MRAPRVWLVAAALGPLLGCRSSTQAPEPGAVLLRVNLAAGAVMPDELRLSAYDDSGTLWSDARFPSEGPVVPQSTSVLGTILLEPGTTVGDLRIDLRGLRDGALADEALLTVTPEARATGIFDAALSAALPSDGDGDGVPDPIDDCPARPDPAQRGCTVDAGGAGGSAGSGGRSQAGGEAGGGGGSGGAGGRAQAGTGGATGGSVDAGRDAPAENLPPGAGCGIATQCRSGFCKDGVCCDSACTGPCNSCATGTCTPVTSGEDAPECTAPMSCNKKGKCVAN